MTAVGREQIHSLADHSKCALNLLARRPPESLEGGIIFVADTPKNMAAPVSRRLLNHAHSISADPNLILLWYGLERLLYRLSVSPHVDRFVLKGVMLFRLWGGDDFRATRDLDLLSFVKAHRGQVMRKMHANLLADLVNLAARLSKPGPAVP
jgi:hypothetical protein